MKDFHNFDFNDMAVPRPPSGSRSQPYAFRLPVYLPPLPLYISRAAVRPTHLTHADVECTWVVICDRAGEIPADSWMVHPVRDDLIFAVHQKRFYIAEKKTHTLVAGDSQYYPLCRPDLTGRGYGSALRIVRSLMDMLRLVTHYSPTGFHAAVSAHRQLVWWVLSQGMSVPGNVLQDYEFDPRAGGIRLRHPYGMNQHNRFWGHIK